MSSNTTTCFDTMRNFVQSEKGGSLHIPKGNGDKDWNQPLCGRKAEHWNVYGLTADEFMEQRKRWNVCAHCRWTVGHSSIEVVPVQSWRWSDE